MRFDWVRRLLPISGASSAPVESVRPAATHPVEGLRYPPADGGLPLREPAAILAANEDLIERLRVHAAVSEEQFAARFVGPLQRLAEYVNVVPATAAGLFAGEMGLFRAALESAFYSFQASDGRIFTGSESVERRHALEARWRYLCFLAGMVFPVGRPLERIVVTAAGGGVWKRHFGGVDAWARAERVERVFVSWGSADEDAIGPAQAGVVLLPQLVGAANLQHLENGAADMVASLYQLAAGTPGFSRIAHQVVTGCWERIQRREAARRPQTFGRLVVGTHQGPYLVGAVRALVAQGTWAPNKSCLKADQDGLYLQWPAAAEDLIAFGRERSYAGWPSDPATMAALLAAAKIVEDRSSDLGMVEIVDDHGEINQALKITNPLAVLEDFDPAEYAGRPAKTVEGVVRSDPLARASYQAPAMQPAAVGSPERAAPVQQVGSTADESAEGEVEEGSDGDSAAAGSSAAAIPTPATAMPSAPRVPDEAVAAGKGKLIEAPEVRYSDLVPDDIQKDIVNALQIELLGKIIKAWRDRGDGSQTMRRTDSGAAFALGFLTHHIRDVPTWVDFMARAGLIYCPPSTPGLRIQKVSIPEGRKPVEAVVLNSLACRRLGL